MRCTGLTGPIPGPGKGAGGCERVEGSGRVAQEGMVLWTRYAMPVAGGMVLRSRCAMPITDIGSGGGVWSHGPAMRCPVLS
eukprot:222702-Rhodomonas_salina.4